MLTPIATRRARLLAAGAGVALALGLLAGPVVAEVDEATSVTAPAPTYGAVEYEWTDPLRGRAVPVRLYLPATMEPGARIPLVVFSHGIGGSRRGYSYLGSHFAANGIASLHVQHVGSDRALWIGNPFSLIGRLHDAAQEREAVNRVLDLRFALDQLLAGEHGSKVDTAQIVVAGHSYGANTALLAAGARVERDGRVLEFRDPRFSAAILISAPPFYGESDPAKILKHVTVPTLAHHRHRRRDPDSRVLLRRERSRGGVRSDRQYAQDAGGLRGRFAQHLHRSFRYRRRAVERPGEGRHARADVGIRHAGVQRHRRCD